MKQNLIFKAIGIAMACSALATPAMAQSSSMDNPSQEYSNVPDYMRPLDYQSWGNQPRTQLRDEPRPSRAGAQGPKRTDDAQGSRWDRTKSFFAQPVGNRGELGYLMWRESNTDTP